MDRGTWRAIVHRVAESETTEQLTHIHMNTFTDQHTHVQPSFPSENPSKLISTWFFEPHVNKIHALR